MLLTAKMAFIQIVILEKDFLKTVNLLGEYGWLEIKRQKDESAILNDHNTQNLTILGQKIKELCDFLNIKQPDKMGTIRPLEEIDQYISGFYEKLLPIKKNYEQLSEKKRILDNELLELAPYKKLNISRKELESFNFFYYTIGKINPDDLKKISESFKGQFEYIELSDEMYLFLTTRKGRWSLESELNKYHFKSKPLPLDPSVLPSQRISEIQNELKQINLQINEINQNREKLLTAEINKLTANFRDYNLLNTFHELNQSVSHSKTSLLLEGWIIEKNVKLLTQQIRSLLKNHYYIVSYLPEELEEVKNGSLKIPVSIENFFIFKKFEPLIYNYGTPVYGSINPTFFMALSFLLLFGFMFGDIGQGLVILLIGLIIRYSKKAFHKLKPLAPIIQYAGIMAMIFGYIYGSIFCFEYEYFETIFRPINKMLFGLDQAYLLNTSLTGSINNVFNLVIITIGIGLLINLTGILFNIINNLLQKQYYEAVLSRNGIAGFILLGSLFLLYLEASWFKSGFSTLLFYIIPVCLFIISLKNIALHIYQRKKPLFPHGFMIGILEIFVEILEVILITLSNNISFIRVAAFAITHALLSFIFLKIASLFGGFGIIIIILGNMIIIGLEGLIVGIQTVRLEYYEFFSKFFNQKGKQFHPFKIEKFRSKEYA